MEIWLLMKSKYDQQGLVHWVNLSGQEAVNDDFESHILFPEFVTIAPPLTFLPVYITECTYLNQYRPNITTYYGHA